MRLAARPLQRALSSPSWPRTSAPRACCSHPRPVLNRQSRSYAHVADLKFGQPVYETHPHLLQPGEVTPGITAIEYAERRARLAKSLPPNSLAILAGSDLKFRSGSVFYKFHQDADFYYLTGFNEPEALAIIERPGAGPEHIFHLFVRPKDDKAERWEGSRSGIQAAQDVFNADVARDIGTALTTVPKLVKSAKEVYTDIPVRSKGTWTFNRIVYGAEASKTEGISQVLQDSSIRPLRPMMNDLRVFKSDAEIALLRKAGQASGRAFTEAMRREFTTEKDLDNFMEYQFKANGCDESAYVPVVAGGENAIQIHYVRNDDILSPGSMVTVDAGGECGGYITDITRTWPVDGRFTVAQREMYEMILAVQRSCLSLCRQDANLSLDKLHSIADQGLRDGLKHLGFDLSNNAMESLFPHHLGHYIGLGVHDAPGYSRTGTLRDSQCITIEPGVYVDNSDRWPKHFRNLGIRIEDSVCVQAETPLILTAEAVKEVVDIEALRR